MDKNTLGPAERIINTILTYSDHLYHGRPGMITKAPHTPIGVLWQPVKHKPEAEGKVVYRMDKVGNKTKLVRVGLLQENNQIKEGGRVVAEYRPAGLFHEVATWMYRQVAEVWKLDNEFCARWASHAFGQEHRDLKVVLAAFMLVQSRKGDPVLDGGKVVFHDEDYRDVGEAMLLLTRKDGKDFNPKLVARVQEFLRLPGVAAINRELGFGKSARTVFYGRYDSTVEKWLRYREENQKMLDGLVKAGFRQTVMTLAKRVHYKPTSSKFFETLRWKQGQSDDGRRSIAIGKEVSKAETWEGLSEKEICQKIVKDRPNFKRVVGLLPKGQSLSRAIVAASIESNAMSDKDLIIYTPTLEELGLLEVASVKERWEKAVKSATDTRAANIMTRVKSVVTQEKLQVAADTAVQKAVDSVAKDIEFYILVDISGSMEKAIEAAKTYIAKLLPGLPLERMHVAVFNTVGRVVEIKHRSTAGVEQAFKGIKAGGGTDYGSGVRALQHIKPKNGEDVVFLIFGDEEAPAFAPAVRQSGLNPMAIGFVKTVPNTGASGWRAATYGTDNNIAVRHTAAELSIPCIMISEETFNDVYAIPRTLRDLISSTPVTQRVVATPAKPRETLVDVILKTDLLQKPVWAP